jgi:SOS-response transcriptional repressor LexA
MHLTQQKLLHLLETGPLIGLTLREIGTRVGEPDSPQKIKHHLDQLVAKGFVRIDKQANLIEKNKPGAVGKFISLPIMGSANCGAATFFADDQIEGYLQVTKGVLGELIDKVKNLFVLRAVGSSMNRAKVNGETIEDGDFVIVDKKNIRPKNGAYVVSTIGGVANIKRIHIDQKNSQIVLLSESSQDIPPIYIHESDLDEYAICGVVAKVLKQPDELESFRNTAALDTLKALGPMSDEESNYYKNL